MQNKRSRVPSYRLHKASGKAVVTLGGRDLYLGAHGSAESKSAYDRAITEYLENGRELPPVAEGTYTVAKLILAYAKHAERTQSERQFVNIKSALRPLRKLYGDTPAGEFSPKCLRRVQDQMIKDDLSRGTIAAYIKIIRRAWRWAAGEELVPSETAYKLTIATESMRDGMKRARATKPVEPVADALIDATLPHMPKVAADLIQLVRLTGCRPGEACNLTAADIDVSGAVWVATLKKHKTAGHGKVRQLAFGPKAQAILRDYLSGARDLSAPLFNPRLAVEAQGKDASWCGNGYTAQTIRQAIHNAAHKAGVPTWNPNQARHSRASEVRRTHGIEQASAILGHSSLNTSLIYASNAIDIAKQVAAVSG